jgi:hypothetical protein
MSVAEEPRQARDELPHDPAAGQPDPSPPIMSDDLGRGEGAPGTQGGEDRGKGEDGGEDGGERGGPRGPEPTRYGDWERKGIAVDF